MSGKNHEGSGPGLKEPNDKFQNSNGAFSEHVEDATEQVGTGPSLNNSKRQQHDEHENWDVRSRDFGVKNDSSENSDGSGPTLHEPDDEIQKSDEANDKHLNDASRKVGAGPGLRNSFNSEHTEHSSDNHHNEHVHPLLNAPTYRTNTSSQKQSNDLKSHKSVEELEHQSTLSSIRTNLGLSAEPPIIGSHQSHNHLTWSSLRYVLREPFAEFFGVFIMVCFGDGSVAQVLLSNAANNSIISPASAAGGMGYGSYQSINWGWGLGVMLGIYIAGDSGGFLNPAVTFAFCVYRKLPWRRFPIYFIAQLLAGFIGSGVVYGNYINAINAFEGGSGIRTVPPSSTATAGIFCTYPQAFLTKTSQFFSEFIASTILMFVIFALKDDSNPGAMGKSGAGKLFPLALLFLIFGLGACFG